MIIRSFDLFIATYELPHPTSHVALAADCCPRPRPTVVNCTRGHKRGPTPRRDSLSHWHAGAGEPRPQECCVHASQPSWSLCIPWLPGRYARTIQDTLECEQNKKATIAIGGRPAAPCSKTYHVSR
jgi:hypothetical protein